MKKALFAALCFMLVSYLMVSGTFAMPDLDAVFADLTELLGDVIGNPQAGGAGTPVHVALVSDQTPHTLYPGGEASRAAWVQNQGEGDVYFRLVYAVQYNADSWDKLSISFSVGEGFIEHSWQDIIISGMPYKMKVFTYAGALNAGTCSSPVQISIAMGDDITSEQMSRYRSDFLQMQVLAIDPTPFVNEGCTTAVAALDMALPLDTLSPF